MSFVSLNVLQNAVIVQSEIPLLLSCTENKPCILYWLQGVLQEMAPVNSFNVLLTLLSLSQSQN